MNPSRASAVIVFVIGVFASIVSPNPMLVLFAGSVFSGAILLLWPKNDAPLLLLPFAVQWIAVSMKPLQTAILGVPINQLGEYGADLEPAAYFALAALAALAIGMRIGSSARRRESAEALAQSAAWWRGPDLIKLSLAVMLFGHLCAIFWWRAGPAQQIVLGFSGIRLVGLFALTYWCLSQKKQRGLLAIVVIFEVGFGMTGFFADFTASVMVLIIAALAATPRLRPRALILGSLGGAFLLSVFVFWSAIKSDYRDFVSRGTQQQVVAVPISDRLQYLLTAMASFDRAKFEEGFQSFVHRVGYIDYLAHTMENVPARVPHENGARALEGIAHVLQPRIFFPDKPAQLNDTIITAHYTGLWFTDMVNTSISIGYLGELYIDFGLFGGWLAALLFGVGIGRIYRIVRGYRGADSLLNCGFAAMAMLPFIQFERGLLKTIGAGFMTMAAVLLLQRLILPRLLAFWSMRRPVARRPAHHRYRAPLQGRRV